MEDYSKYSKVKIGAINKSIKGEITLGGSKSISNRALIIQALCNQDFEILKLSPSQDTKTLLELLQHKSEVYDAGHAGTTFRFMTAYLSTQKGTQVLTGSDRMKERPIGELVNALNELGANIEYLEKDGYPPLKINTPNEVWKKEISINGSISSQFITALLLIAPTLNDGLTVAIEGNLVSRPYLEMTLSLMAYFGVKHVWNENKIHIAKQDYVAKDFEVEADWSSASYLFALAAINEGCEIKINGLSENSIQGDSAIRKMTENLGVDSSFENGKLTIKNNPNFKSVFEYDFKLQPDLAQTIACICAAKGITGLFTGLETLYIKETDRVAALKNELQKFNVFLSKLPTKFTKTNTQESFMQEGNSSEPNAAIETYKDHRMALAFAVLACKHDVEILDPKVIKKSYPNYWEDLTELGFKLSFSE